MVHSSSLESSVREEAEEAGRRQYRSSQKAQGRSRYQEFRELKSVIGANIIYVDDAGNDDNERHGDRQGREG
jgi:hypothetical protein